MIFKRIKKLILLFFIFSIFTSLVLIYYIKGYVLDNPQSCTICHIMKEHFDSWEKSTHRKVTTCNDCHIPQWRNKYKEEIKIGYRHTINFLLNKYEEPVKITDENFLIVQENCYKCHNYSVYLQGFRIVHHNNMARCESCHKDGLSAGPCSKCHDKSSHAK